VAQTPPQRHGKVTYFQRPAAPPAFGRGGGHWPPTGLLPPLATPLGEGRLYPSPAPFAHRLHTTGATPPAPLGRRGLWPKREPHSGHTLRGAATGPLPSLAIRGGPTPGGGCTPALLGGGPLSGHRAMGHWPPTGHLRAIRGGLPLDKGRPRLDKGTGGGAYGHTRAPAPHFPATYGQRGATPLTGLPLATKGRP